MILGLPHAQAVVHRKLAPLPEGWEIYKFEAILGTDAVVFTGGVPRLITRGPHKGKKSWRGVESRKAVVTREEEKEESDRYERETGNCGRCLGTGEVFAEWHHINGTTMRQCPRCKGAKIAPEVAR